MRCGRRRSPGSCSGACYKTRMLTGNCEVGLRGCGRCNCTRTCDADCERTHSADGKAHSCEVDGADCSDSCDDDDDGVGWYTDVPRRDCEIVSSLVEVVGRQLRPEPASVVRCQLRTSESLLYQSHPSFQRSALHLCCWVSPRCG